MSRASPIDLTKDDQDAKDLLIDELKHKLAAAQLERMEAERKIDELWRVIEDVYSDRINNRPIWGPVAIDGAE